MKAALLSLLLTITAVVVPVSAQARAQSYRLDIPRQPLDAALKDLAQQTGFQIARFSDTPGGGLLVGPLSGDMVIGQALTSLLLTSGLSYKMVNDRTIAVIAPIDAPVSAMSTGSVSSEPTRRAYAPTPRDSEKNSKRDSSNGVRVAQAAPGKSSSAAELEAQQAPERKAEELGSIIVTAEKRESTIQHTPISITAASGQDLQERGFENLSAFARSVPSVSMRTSGPGQTEFEMRGMASTGGNSPTVGFYVDDVALTAPAFSSNGKIVVDPNLYDLSRVEVLRGPQGTLYGSGSMGGTIKLVTNAPNPAAFDASAEATVSDTDGGGFNDGVHAMLNIPLGSTAALRFVGSASRDSGWIDRIVTADEAFPIATDDNMVRGDVLAAPVGTNHEDVNDADLQSLRGSFLWTPTDRFDIGASYFYEHLSQDGQSHIDSDPGTNAHYQPFDAAEPFSDNFNLGSVNLTYKFEAFDLTSITSRWTRDVTYTQDGAEEWTWVLGLPSYYTSQGGIGPVTPTPLETEESDQTSEELRLTSSGDTRFQWLLGYFYSDFNTDTQAYFTSPGIEPLFGTTNMFSLVQSINVTQNALFGDVSYQFTPQLRGSVGARWYSYDFEMNNDQWGAFTTTGSDEHALGHASASETGTNPRFALSYEPSDKLNLYASIAKGFRPGGGNPPIPTSGPAGDACEAALQEVFGTTEFVPSPLTYDADSVWSYEVGEKWRTLENRVVVNGAVYYSDWKGIQQNIPLTCGYGFQANAGDAEVYGGEVEIQALLGDDFELSVNAGYTHAELTSSNVFGVGIDPGTPVQQVPDWTSTQSLAYHHEIADGLRFTARIENNYVGLRTDATFAVNQLPSYNVTAIRTGVESRKWSAVLFATNVFNEEIELNNATQISINVPTYNRVVVHQPLTIGLNATFRFGQGE